MNEIQENSLKEDEEKSRNEVHKYIYKIVLLD